MGGHACPSLAASSLSLPQNTMSSRVSAAVVEPIHCRCHTPPSSPCAILLQSSRICSPSNPFDKGCTNIRTFTLESHAHAMSFAFGAV